MSRVSPCFCVVLAACLLAQAWAVPADRPGYYRRVRSPQNEDKTVDTTTTPKIDPLDDDDDDGFDESLDTAPSTDTGSNIISLLNLATALFPSSSSSNRFIRNIIRQILRNPESLTQLFGVISGFRPVGGFPALLRRKDIKDNVIDVDYVKKLTPPFQRQEDEDDDYDSSDDEDSDSDSEENDAAEESIETANGNSDNGNDKASKQNSGNDDDDGGDDDNDSDYSDEPPEGDGQGGGILGLLASLSGGEDGQSDLGTLLGVVSGIVANLSGDGFDLNALIASGLGLFVGLLSEGEENPGAVLASYLLTSLDTITEGGAKNNGAFFGTLISKLVKGTSAAGVDSASSEENGNGMKMTDSTGFFVSLLMGLLGDMSKGSSGGSSH